MFLPYLFSLWTDGPTSRGNKGVVSEQTDG